jgi:predicted RNase H-like nuclease
MTLAGIDGCRGGWLCVSEQGGEIDVVITAALAPWLGSRRPHPVVIDMPIGLPGAGPRECDGLARKALRPGRASSVFSAPVRGALGHPTYEATCAAHRAIDGRGLSLQAWFILPKIAEVDAVLQADRVWRTVLHEGHPELSFATWNGGAPMSSPKRSADGRAERRALADGTWPGAVGAAIGQLPGQAYALDDLLDAFALLWTARRLERGTARCLPARPQSDGTGLAMAIVA